MQSQSLCPVLRWAQKKDKIFATIMLRDIQNQQTKIQQKNFKFTGTSSGKYYQLYLQLYKNVIPKQSSTFKTGSSLLFELIKQQNKTWPRLTKQNKKLPYILVDWDRWDEQSEQQQRQTKKLFSDDNQNQKNNQSLEENYEDQIEIQKKQVKQNMVFDDDGEFGDDFDRPQQNVKEYYEQNNDDLYDYKDYEKQPNKDD